MSALPRSSFATVGSCPRATTAMRKPRRTIRCAAAAAPMAEAVGIPKTFQLDKVKLGTSDLEVTKACIGTMMMGSANTEEEAWAQLDHFRSRGGNFIDSAEMYPVPPTPEWTGDSERIIGRWLKERGCRDEFVIATKVAGHLMPQFLPLLGNDFDKDDPNVCEVSRKNIRRGVEGSLERLQIDCIDLFQLHWPARYVPLFGRSRFDPKAARPAPGFDVVVEAMGELIEEGKIKAWGVSNETAYGLTMMCETAQRLGVPLPATIQNDFSLCDRKFDMDLAEVCHVYGVRLIPYGVLAGGFLSGKYRGGAQPEGARHTTNPDFQPRYRSDRVAAAVEKYAALAESKGLTLTQLAVGWASQRWHISSIITGQTKVEQMDEYLSACGLELDEETLEAIDKIHMEDRNPEWGD
eukprot:jgi/Ulvmu1/3258/UM151_0006.1